MPTPPTSGGSDRAALVVQLVRYGVTGGFVTLLAVAVYWIVATPLGVAPLLANLAGYLSAVAAGYFIHSRWSFRGHGRRGNLARTGGRFVMVSLVSLALNSLFVWALTGPMGGPTWWPIAPMVLVTPLVTFALNRFWVFG